MQASIDRRGRLIVRALPLVPGRGEAFAAFFAFLGFFLALGQPVTAILVFCLT